MLDNEQTMNKDWVSVLEAIKLTNKAEMTIRRFVTEHKNNEKIIKKNKGKVYININFLSKFYSVHHDSQMLDNEQIKHQKDFAELTLKKHDKDIINKLIESQHKPFLRLPVLWVSIVSIIAIALLCGAFSLYRSELITNHQTQVKNLNTRIDDLKSDLKKTQTAYNQSQKNIDTLYQKYNSTLETSNKLLAMKEQHDIVKLEALKKAPETVKN